MKVSVINLIDFEKVNVLLEGFNKSTGFVTAILDLEGNVLSKSGWRQICTEFHRVHPETSTRCTFSDTVLANKMKEGEKYHSYQCLNGLIDVAVPIVIKGEHIANLFSGQFFFEKPDTGFFKKQAEKFGFDEKHYLNLLAKVPVVSKEKVLAAMDFLLDMTQLISEITYQKLEQVEMKEEIRQSELRFKALHNASFGGIFIHDKNTLLDFNQGLSEMTGYAQEELIGMNVLDLIAKASRELVNEKMNSGYEKPYEAQCLHKTGRKFPVRIEARNVPYKGKTARVAEFRDITERKKNEQLLAQSEERKRSYFEQAPYGIFIVNKKGKYVEVNPEACKITGYSEKELLKKSIPDLLLADDLEIGLKHFEKLHKTGNAYGEFRFRTKAGNVRWWSVASAKLSDNLLLGFCEDITERKEAEKAISHSHDLMKYIIEHNQSAIAVHDKNLNYIFVSQRYLEDYRVKEKDVIGKHHYEVFPDIPEKWRKVHQKALNGIVSRADEDKFYREDGTLDWTRWECRPWYEADGSIGGIIVYTEVINEQKRKEEEIKKLNNRLEILIDSIQKLSASQSLVDVQTIVAKSARKLIGADGATLVFQENGNCSYVDEDAILPLWKGKKFPMHSCISGWVMKNKKPVVIEDIFTDDRIPKDVYSPTFVKSLAMVPVVIKEPIGAIGNYWKEKYTPTDTEMQLLQTLANAAARAIENINLHAELEERVKQRTEQLHKVNKELETFTYSVSHDLKAPLRGIDGYSKLLQKEYGDNLNEEATHFINVIRDSTLQMNQLIEDLLSYSRLERSQLRNEEIALKPFIKQLLSSYTEEFQRIGATIKTNLPDKQITVDSIGLSIALRNFLENALKFTDEKRKAIIEFGYEENADAWLLFVKDNGLGFDMKYHDRIFEIFQRLHRAEDYAGTGIGLAMVAKALQRMGGKTWARSEPGKGATFFIEIPKDKAI